MIRDLRYALRAMRQSPLFVSVAMFSLAVGIGANTAIFSLLDQLLLRPLAVRAPHQLVQLDLPGPRSGNSWNNRPFSFPMFQSLRDGNQTFDGLAAQFAIQASFVAGDRSEFVKTQLVSGNWFETIGVTTALGRSIANADDVTLNGHPVVVLMHGFWVRRFGSDAGILNKTILLNNQRMTVIGVASPGFRGTDVVNPVDLVVPLAMQKLLMPNTSFPMESPRLYFLNLFGRVKNGVTLDQVRADLNRVVGPVLMEEAKLQQFRNANLEKRFLAKQMVLFPAASGNLSDRSEIELAMWLLTALVGGLLLIACANVANLLLARATTRRRETAIRLALGASRVQLMRLVLAESLLLSLGGGALGMLAAHWAGDALLALANVAGSTAIPLQAAPDGRVMTYTAVLSLLTGLLFGWGPAWAAAKPELTPALKDGASNLAGGGAAGWIRKGLIVFQVAISMLLIAAAALFLTTLDNLRRVNPGFDTNNLIAFSVNPAMNGYDMTRQDTFYQRLTDELSLIPRVGSVSMATEALLADSMSQSTVRVEGYQPGDDESMNPMVNEVGPAFFQTMKIPILNGREFTEADRRGSQEVAIVSQAFAGAYFKGRDPIGRKIGFAGTNKVPYITIVGIVKETRHLDLRDEDSKRQVYTPSAQCRLVGGRTFYLRTPASLEAVVPGIRAAVRNLDASLPVDGIRTMRQQMEVSLTLERLVTTLCTVFGLIATLLAAIGLYGVMAFHVSRRTREIGVRMALGAQRSNVLGLVIREAAILTGTGVAVGIPLALALSRFTRGFVFGVQPTNFWIYVGAAALLLTTALLASLLPARRASRIDPIRALRYE